MPVVLFHVAEDVALREVAATAPGAFVPPHAQPRLDPPHLLIEQLERRFLRGLDL